MQALQNFGNAVKLCLIEVGEAALNWTDNFDIADLGAKPENVMSYRGDKSVFRTITLDWHDPVEWSAKSARPSWSDPGAMKRLGIYAIMRDHANASQRCQIEYIGMAKSLHSRLDTTQHSSAKYLSAIKGQKSISVAFLKHGKGSESRAKEIEDILIWTFWKTIINKTGLSTLPSMRMSSGRGQKLSRPWIINNTGYHFEDQMPEQIVYPWILTSRSRVT